MRFIPYIPSNTAVVWNPDPTVTTIVMTGIAVVIVSLLVFMTRLIINGSKRKK